MALGIHFCHAVPMTGSSVGASRGRTNHYFLPCSNLRTRILFPESALQMWLQVSGQLGDNLLVFEG